MLEFHYSTWGYVIEPIDTGSRVTEWNEDLRPESALEFSKQVSGINDRGERNRQTMRVEPSSASPRRLEATAP